MLIRLVLASSATVLLFWAWKPLPHTYRAEQQLAQANQGVKAVLKTGQLNEAAKERLSQAVAAARTAQMDLPGDPRPALTQAIAYLILQQYPAAESVLLLAISQGERPELTLNLGRARGSMGDQAAAERAFVRTAWISQAGIKTLPKTLRERIFSEVTRLDGQLRNGQLVSSPSL
jgi:Flp pilus assembly protein TadD